MEMFYRDQARTLTQLETSLSLRLILGLTVLGLMVLLLLFQPIVSAPQAILFIDPAVAGYQTLIEGVKPGVEVVTLDPDRDGVEQIGQLLQTKSNISSLHIVSHGSPGHAQLGAARLNLANLNDYADRLQQWATALAPGGDILLYGCDVAADEGGLTFARRLGELTGADVAASTNRTGAAALGGDWTFEFTTGEIQTALAFAPATTTAYEAVLTRPVLDNAGDPTLPPIDEDEPEASNQGILLADLIAQIITDTDPGAIEGIAVTGLSGNGVWQYSLDGLTWQSFGSVSDSQATVLKVLTPLYDGLVVGTPNTQGWLVSLGVATQTLNVGSTTFDSTGDFAIKDGYSSHLIGPVNPAYPTLNAATGYTIRFEVKINGEDHSAGSAQKNSGTDTIADRAGFSIISISSDTTKGLELGFWEDEIWAQEDGIINNPPYPIFTHGTNSISYTTTATTTYDLNIQSNNYELFAGGTPILTGALRDYTNWPTLPNPYVIPNYLFLGDDTASAKASFTLSHAEILEKTRIRFVPDQDFNGAATITFRAWDLTDGSSNGDIGVDTSGGAFSAANEVAAITVNPVNDPPTISNIRNQKVIVGATVVGPIDFTIDDVDTPIETLSVTVASSNQDLVPDANIVLGGSRTDRTLTITPTANLIDKSTITVMVDDGLDAISDTFKLRILEEICLYLPLILK